MSSLRDNFAELLTRIQHGREFGHASFEPIYYLVFPPQQILEVKRQFPAWMARLHNEGWEVHVFSIAEAIAELLGQAPLRRIWLTADRNAPLAWDKTNRSLANALTRGALQARPKRSLRHWKDTVTRWSWSRTSRPSIPTSGLAPLKASCKGNSCPHGLFVSGSQHGQDASQVSRFLS